MKTPPMKTQYLPRIFACLFAASLATASAATLTWNPTGVVPYSPPADNTPGTWSTSDATWWNGASNQVWNNAGGDVASFPETLTQSPVTLGSNVTVASFSTSISSFVTIGNNNPNNYSVTIEGTVGSGVVATGAQSAWISFDAPVNFSTAIRTDFSVSDSTRLRFNNGITSSGDINLNIGNFNTTRIGGSSTYTGQTIINGSAITLEVAGDSALGASTLVVRSSSSANYIEAIDAPRTIANDIDMGTYWFTDTNKNLTIRGSQDLTFDGNVSMTSAEGGTAFLNVDTVTATFNGNFTAPPGSYEVVKGGNGTLIMNGTNSYTGATTINAGTFGGDATLAGALVINAGGTLAPGNSPGLLSVASLDLNGATLLEINGTTRGTQYDGINIVTGGTIDFGGSLTLNFGNVSAFSGEVVFDLFNFDTTSTGNFSSFTSTGFAAYSGTWTLTGDVWTLDGNPDLTFSELTGDLTVVPEPATSILLGFGLAALLAFRRRRRA